MSRVLILALLFAAACASTPTADPAPPTTATGDVAPTVATVAPSPSATTSPTRTVPATTETTTAAPSIELDPLVEAALADGCRGLATPPAVAELTFVSHGHLFRVVGEQLECLAQAEDIPHGPLIWGPTGHRFADLDGRVTDAVGRTEPLSDISGPMTWTRPTGQSLIYRNVDGTLTKQGIDSAAVSKLTPLETHDAIAYHPDGLTFAVSGVLDGQYGLFIASNDGTEPQVLAFGDDVLISEIAFTDDATWLYFVADHGDTFHIHAIFLETVEIGDGQFALNTVFEDNAEPIVERSAPISNLVVTTNGDLGHVAYSVGMCEDLSVELAVEGEDYEWRVSQLAATRPVGFLEAAGVDGVALAYATSVDGCEAESTIGVWEIDEFGDAAHTFTSDLVVQAVGVRRVAEEPIFTLSGVVIEGFA